MVEVADKLFGKAGRRRALSPTLEPHDKKRLFNAFRVVEGVEPDFASALRKLARKWIDDGESLELRATSLLVADLFEQGWRFSIQGGHIVFEPPGLSRDGDEDLDAVKARVRQALEVGRERQLAEPSVRQFIARMERQTLRPDGRRTSVLDLIDSGATLAEAIERLKAEPSERQAAALKALIDPEIEVCEAGVRCKDSGLLLIDIWRYFRHTWRHEYRSIPGRQMMLLVRNRARPNRPVIGIAMLASPVMRLSTRDDWIGWLRPAAERLVMSDEWPAHEFGKALFARLEASIADLRWDDLAKPDEIANPTEAVVFRLQQVAYGAAAKREAALRETYGAEGATAKRPPRVDTKNADLDWIAASEDLLFVRKRAEGLAELLLAKMILSGYRLRGAKAAKAEAERLFANKRGQRAVDIALTEFRKAGLSSRVSDVSVCGAVHPYNELLGGKLVALLLCSKEVRQAYAKRYGGQISVIASQMAGRPIYKPADLQILTTTSLYGVGSSQYNRLALRAKDHPGLPFTLRWRALKQKHTGGYGTLHLGAETVDALRRMGEMRHDARRINNLFGEGTSPRLRQVREGLDALGVDSDQVLHHATPRIFYGCELSPNARHALLSMKPGGAGRKSPKAAVIGEAWRARWLAMRINNPDLDLPERLRRLGSFSVQATLRASDDDQLLLDFD